MCMKQKILVCVDTSYFLHYIVFGSVNEFLRKHHDEASLYVKNPEDVDQKNLPDLLVSATYKRILKNSVMKRLETIEYLLKSNFQNELDAADGIDYVFACDDYASKNFRKAIYPQYKANRKLKKRSYDNYKIHKYILNVLLPEMNAQDHYGYHMIKIDGAEGDDVIATVFENLKDQYMLNVLFASDRDFVQIDGIHQLNLFGKLIERKVADEPVTAEEYLLAKIIQGDGADNIPKLFYQTGEKKTLKLIRNKSELKERLTENESAARQFRLNERLISFAYIPKELKAKIMETVNKELYSNDVLNKDIDLKDFMML